MAVPKKKQFKKNKNKVKLFFKSTSLRSLIVRVRFVASLGEKHPLNKPLAHVVEMNIKAYGYLVTTSPQSKTPPWYAPIRPPKAFVALVVHRSHG